jgi:predicted ATP-dependent endonuclease of OLD family
MVYLKKEGVLMKAFKREFYIPKNATKIENQDLKLEFYLSETDGKYKVVAFSGRRQKPDFNYWYNTEQQRLDKINDVVTQAKNIKDIKDRQNQIKKQKKAEILKSLKVGDIFHSSWGYDQTNANVYQLISFKGSTGVFREISQQTTKVVSGMSEYRKAVPDSFIGEEFKARIGNYGNIKVDYGQTASKIDKNKEFYVSWYA